MLLTSTRMSCPWLQTDDLHALSPRKIRQSFQRCESARSYLRISASHPSPPDIRSDRRRAPCGSSPPSLSSASGSWQKKSRATRARVDSAEGDRYGRRQAWRREAVCSDGGGRDGDHLRQDEAGEFGTAVGCRRRGEDRGRHSKCGGETTRP